MKKIITILILCTISLIQSYAQKIGSRYWETISDETIKVLEINKTFNSNSEITLSDRQINELSSIYIDGYIQLNSDSSFVRVTIEDYAGLEYLILEANYLTVESEMFLNHFFEETGYIENYTAKQINITIIDAYLFIQ